jgi:hypothetical protein
MVKFPSSISLIKFSQGSKARDGGDVGLIRLEKQCSSNFFLSSLPIFECSLLLYPQCTLEKMSKVLQSFLWVGGKKNTKKFHLLNWKQVCQPINKGGLAIKYPILMKTSLGEKVVWSLIFGPRGWWKSTLLTKYFTSSRL